MRVSKIIGVLSFAVIAAAFCVPAQAAGKGKGRTKTQFKAWFDAESLAKNRLFMKLDVSAAVAELPEVGSKSKNDEIGGQDLTVTVNTETLTESVADNGRVNTATFKARLTANGKILHVDLRGLDLPTLLGLDAADDGKGFSTVITVTVSLASSSEVAEGEEVPEPTTLFSGDITVKYRQKADKHAKGRS